MKKIIVANWKMNKNTQDIDFWVDEFLNKYAPNIDFTKVNIVVAPSHPYLQHLFQIKDKFQICAQDVHAQQQGTFTGSVAAFQIREFAKYVLVGHSETKSTFKSANFFFIEKNHLDYWIAGCPKMVEYGLKNITLKQLTQDFNMQKTL